MTNRKKRLKKGIESLQIAIEEHIKKKKLAREIGQEELVEYYEKEIKALQERKEDRKEKLNR